MRKNAALVACVIGLVSCSTEQDPFEDLKEIGEEMMGGDATVFDLSVNAFGHAAPNLTGTKDLEFVTGNAFFKRNWVTSPASTEDLDGLGPLFNARSCSACHLLDGRGAPPTDAVEEPLGLLFRLSVSDGAGGTKPDTNYGGQFNNHATQGVDGEGKVSVTYEEINGTYPDGTAYALRKPKNTFYDLNYGGLPADLMVSPRVAPHMVGLGLLEAVDESTLLAFADEHDTDNDGISGRPNYVWDILKGEKSIGRFGWKSNQPTVRQQVAGAFRGDIGITSALFPEQPCAEGQADCEQAYAENSPELTNDILDRVALYSATLAVPGRRDWEEPEVLKGKELFGQLNCTACHIPKMTTGSNGEVPEFENQTIRPYTDLLLHDMGEELADHRPDELATGLEWRTPPLWGIGLIHVVSGHTFLLHDGRARNMEEAILWHGGEAQASREAFKNLQKTERQNVIKFLESL